MLARAGGRSRLRTGALVLLVGAALVPGAEAARSQAECPIDAVPEYQGLVPTAKDTIGIKLGHREVTTDEAWTYLDAVDAASDRVATGTYATSVQGRPLRYAVIGRPENVTPDGLESIRQAVLRIRDPATPQDEVAALVASTPAFLYLAGNVHGSEESGADASLRILYELADRTDCAAQSILDNAVVFLFPIQNPDGREADTRRNAYGFDMNRDWFARTQAETDGKVELLRRYPPLLFADAHEFSYYRSFFAPNDDPVYHDAPDQVLSWIDDLFAPALADAFTDRGWGFFHYHGYDFFMPGYGDTVPADGFLAAGFTLEHYNEAPFHLRVDKDEVEFWLLLSLAARNRASLLQDQHDAYVEAVDEGRRGILEPNGLSNPNSTLIGQVPDRRVRQYFLLDDPARAYELQLLVRRLQRMDVQVYRLDAPLDVPDYRAYAASPKARTLPAGTYWIPMAQAQKHWIQLMLNEDTYVPVRRTYDITGWSSPLLMNLAGGSSGLALEPDATLVPPLDEPTWPLASGGGAPRVGVLSLSNAVYAFEGVGELRWLLDTVWHEPYEVLTPEDVAAGGLKGIDVLVVPSGGALVGERKLGPTGVAALTDWVDAGGRYVGYKFGGALLADRLDLTTARFRDSPYQIEGTLIRVHVDRSSPLAEGVGGSVWVMFSDDDTIRVRPSAAPLRYPSAGLATSGLALNTQHLAGQPAAVDEAFGDGRVVVFPYDLNFRGMSQGTQRVLWNAIFGE